MPPGSYLGKNSEQWFPVNIFLTNFLCVTLPLAIVISNQSLLHLPFAFTSAEYWVMFPMNWPQLLPGFSLCDSGWFTARGCVYLTSSFHVSIPVCCVIVTWIVLQALEVTTISCKQNFSCTLFHVKERCDIRRNSEAFLLEWGGFSSVGCGHTVKVFMNRGSALFLFSAEVTLMVLYLADIRGRDWENYVWARIWGRGKHVMEQQRRQWPQFPWKWRFWEQPAFTCFYSIFKVGMSPGRNSYYSNLDCLSLSGTSGWCRKNTPWVHLSVNWAYWRFLHL